MSVLWNVCSGARFCDCKGKRHLGAIGGGEVFGLVLAENKSLAFLMIRRLHPYLEAVLGSAFSIATCAGI
jgi:hypothetical protein